MTQLSKMNTMPRRRWRRCGEDASLVTATATISATTTLPPPWRQRQRQPCAVGAKALPQLRSETSEYINRIYNVLTYFRIQLTDN